jgi:Fic family protein
MDALTQTFGKKAHNASKLVEYLYQQPIISIGEVAKVLEVSKPTANTLVKEFEEKGILQEITGYERNKLYIFEQYLDIYSKS